MTTPAADSAEPSVANALAVEVAFAVGKGAAPDTGFVRLWVGRALAAAKPESLNLEDLSGAREIAVRIVDAGEIRELNARYRGLDRPTNVLSFPAEPVAGLPAGEAQGLGDLVVCAPVVNAEAVSQGKSREAHWAHMLVHGTLHLVGYDHEDDESAAAMEGLETEILGRHGIDDPYEDAKDDARDDARDDSGDDSGDDHHVAR